MPAPRMLAPMPEMLAPLPGCGMLDFDHRWCRSFVAQPPATGTNAYSGLMRGHEGVAHRVREADRVYLPAPVVGELLFGFRGGNRFERNREQLQRFLSTPPVEFVPTDQTVCDRTR